MTKNIFKIIYLNGEMIVVAPNETEALFEFSSRYKKDIRCNFKNEIILYNNGSPEFVLKTDDRISKDLIYVLNIVKLEQWEINLNDLSVLDYLNLKR